MKATTAKNKPRPGSAKTAKKTVKKLKKFFNNKKPK